MADCIFCKIVAGSIPAAKVYEDDKVLAFLDINPVNFGHTLIIPKDHYQTMADTPDKVVSSIFVKAKELMIAIKDGVGADFVVVTVVGVDVPHFHVHLIPRYKDDGMHNFNWPTKKYSEGQMDEVVTKIKTKINK